MRVRKPVFLILFSVLFFLALDNIIFRSGLYDRLSNPETLTGQVSNTIRFERERPPSGKSEVLLTGNSRMHWGFWVKQFVEQHPDSPLIPVQMAIAGTYEEMWYYLLRAVDPHQNRYAAIVVPLASYKVDSWHVDQAKNFDNAEMLAPILSLSAWVGIIRAFDDPDLRGRALMLALFRSHDYALDIQDLIWHPDVRFKHIAEHDKAGSRWLYDWAGSEGSMSDLQFDAEGRITRFPGNLNSFERRDTVTEFTRPSPEDAATYTMRNATYQEKWLNRIIALYNGSKTRLIFLQMPRWPMPLPARGPIAGAPDLRQLLAGGSGVAFIEEDAFTNIEKPEYFYDAVHLNNQGRRVFTKELGDQIVKIMGHS